MQIELDLPLPQIKEKGKLKMKKITLVEDLGMLYPKKTSKRKRHYGIYECPTCKKHFVGVFDNYKKNNLPHKIQKV